MSARPRAGQRYARPLREVYDALNTEFWGGRLPSALRARVVGPGASRSVHVRRVGAPWFGTRGLRAGRGHHAVGLFRPPGPSWPAEIRVLAPLGTDEERRVLLHEMVHLALFLAGHPDAGHGERFAAELERVGARRGAEPVEVAGP